MRPTVRKLAVAFLTAPIAAACVAAGALPASAEASVAFTPCKESNELACAHLTVPLDPSGSTPGTITLAIRRRLAPVGEAHSAVIALAGGPGQSAIPFAAAFTELLGPILDTRDLIVFDQRGTGYSHPLACHGFEQPGIYRTGGQLLKACAEQIGPERAFYTSEDSVADIEALRKALGYEKLVLWGTSYGTKVAEEYAQRVPRTRRSAGARLGRAAHRPRPARPHDVRGDPADPAPAVRVRRSARASPPTPSPTSRGWCGSWAAGPIGGRYVSPHGHSFRVPISANELLDVLLAGDFDPLLRAEFPAAARAAAGGDNAPLARLLVHAFGGEGEEGEGIDTPLYYTTTCEEEDFPWSRAASPGERLAQAKARIAVLPASAFAPFTAANVFDFDELRAVRLLGLRDARTAG